MSLRTGNQIDS